MSELTATRTLVKSPPELWAQCSDAESLGRHLHAFGEIRITRLEPETTVAWEGERASGTVRIEPSGWGTKVTLTADPREGPPERLEVPGTPGPRAPEVAPEVPNAVAAAVVAVAPAPAPTPAPAEARRRAGILGWLFGRRAAGPLLPAGPEPLLPGGPESLLPAGPEPLLPGGPESLLPAGPEPLLPAGPARAGDESPAGVVDPAEAETSPAGACPPVPIDAVDALGAALASLGQAHHRPFSRT